MSEPIHVVALRRFPVKSVLGEIRDFIDLDARGVVGDRIWSVRTAAGKIASGKNTRRFAAVDGMLLLRAGEHDGRVEIAFPDGTRRAVDEQETTELLSGHLGQPVTVARETDVSHFDDGPVSIVGTASIDALSRERGGAVDPLRFRPNIVIDTEDPFVEDGWIGRSLSIGTAVLRVEAQSPRCVMIDMRSAELPAQHGNLKAIGDLNDACLGVIANVGQAGRVSVGDELRLL